MSTGQNTVLDAKYVGDIVGDYYVPSYQRGYRWGRDEVIRLLDDIFENGANPYCLQPIVVKSVDGQYELIDGQQRLTTLYLIYKFMNERSGGFIEAPKFSLKYKTRTESQEFLKDIDFNQKEKYIDYWFGEKTYKCSNCSTRSGQALPKCPKCKAQMTKTKFDPVWVDEMAFYDGDF